MIASITTAELCAEIRNAIATDSALLAWCVAQFGKSPSVWVGIDEENPPAASQYPVIALLKIDQIRGGSKDENVWELTLGIAVSNNGIVTSGITYTYTGMLQAETLRELAEDSIYRAKLSSADSDGQSMSINDYPLFISFSVMTIRILRTTRRAMPGR